MRWPIPLFVLMSGSLTIPCQPSEAQSARLLVSGAEVQVNGLPAVDGMLVLDGDHVSTGERSWARIEWEDGTSVSLDQNSDPIIEWDGEVLVISVGYGWFLVDTRERRVRIVNELAEIIAKSRVCVSVRPDEQFNLWVLDDAKERLKNLRLLT